MNIIKNIEGIEKICLKLRTGFLKYGYKLSISWEYYKEFKKPYVLILVDETSYDMRYFLSVDDIKNLREKHFKVILKSVVFKYHHSGKGNKHLMNRIILDRNYMRKIRKIERMIMQEKFSFSFITYSSYFFEGDLSAELYLYIGNEFRIIKYYAFEYEKFDSNRIVEIYYDAFNFKQICSLEEFQANKDLYIEQAKILFY